MRFGLTSEAGLNDGLAFPFVHLAIALAAVAGTGEPWFTSGSPIAFCGRSGLVSVRGG
ncbi:hypothetical protein ACFQX4_24175 [Roseomonas sp. GCM10028921]